MTINGQPIATDLVELAGKVKGSQDKLRAAMADVAVSKVTQPPAAPSSGAPKT